MTRLDDLSSDALADLESREAERIEAAGGTWEGYRKAKRIGDPVALSRKDRRRIFRAWEAAQARDPREVLAATRAARFEYLRGNPRIARTIRL